jgi:hypothetical protein
MGWAGCAGCSGNVDPGRPVIDSPPTSPLLIDGGEDDMIAGGDDEAILGGSWPNSGVSTFCGRGNTVYMPIVAFP